MKNLRTKAIILRRTNYGEADRILQLLTPQNGRISVIAKGARREKSKLAGGIELLSISDVNLVSGKGDMWTLTGARMDTFFIHILSDYDRMQFAYGAIARVSKVTDQIEDEAFYRLLLIVFESLNDFDIHIDITVSWFWLQLAILEGQGLNLATDLNGMKLVEDKNYTFDIESMAFGFNEHGEFTTNHIKFLRLLCAQTPKTASIVIDNTELHTTVRWLAERVVAH
ncbi:DNA repair protein RecO [Candidatus Saccharibacteria bacterium]|nr:DNA repair protein RecO [Candidatus Saccharibacteria bacterium]NCU40309.1 DNA repair protein RecO [Candidatus Saccharibacteria bacterium]